MAVTLPFFPQETRYSCVPACLRMILADIAISVDEATLRTCCNTDRLGTTAKDVVNCAQDYGLQATAAIGATNSQLSGWLADGQYVIVYLNLFPIDAIWVTHAVVVEAIERDVVTLMDPIAGRRQTPVTSFEQGWQMSKQQVIVLAPHRA